MGDLKRNMIGVAAFFVVAGLVAYGIRFIQPAAAPTTTDNTNPVTNTAGSRNTNALTNTSAANVSVAHEVDGSPPTNAPALYVVQRDGIYHTTFDATTHEYNVPTVFVAMNDVVKVNTTPDSVFIYRQDSVERRDHTGKLMASWSRLSSPTYVTRAANATDQIRLDQLQTGVYDSAKLYLAVNRSMVILDANLQELGHVSPLTLDQVEFGKAIDDIMVIDHDAFVVDDIAVPLFVFSVDITNPRDPKIIHTFGVGGVYGSITNQWFEDRSGKWCMQLSTSSGYVGDQHNVICITPALYHTPGITNPSGGLDSTPSGMTVITIGKNSNGGQDGPATGSGFAIRRDLNHLDDFMLVEQRLSHTDDIVGLGDDYKIQATLNVAQDLENFPFVFYRYDGHVYFYAEDQLMMFSDDGTNLTSQLQQTIPMVAVPNAGGQTGTHSASAWLSIAADPR